MGCADMYSYMCVITGTILYMLFLSYMYKPVELMWSVHVHVVLHFNEGVLVTLEIPPCMACVLKHVGSELLADYTCTMYTHV